MDVIVRAIDKYNDEIIDFLINESCTLYCKLRGCNNLSDENIQKLKNKLRNLYIIDYSKDNIIYIAYDSNKIVGCACIIDNYYLRDLFVKKGYQKQGIGSTLLKNIIFDMKENDEIVLQTHRELVDFYKKHNFEIIKEGSSVKMKVKKY